jgi:tRNA-uridine 2-sulfurtransferase
VFPVGDLTKGQVRDTADRLGLRTASKPDSQDVCFITSTAGRSSFLSDRIPLHPAEVVDHDGQRLGRIDAVELITIGQRRGLGVAGRDDRRFAVAVDVPGRRVTVGTSDDLLTSELELDYLRWTHRPVGGRLLAQTSAHGQATAANLTATTLRWAEPRRRVAPGQTVVLYEADTVVGSALAAG